jgi:hypothetical protein
MSAEATMIFHINFKRTRSIPVQAENWKEAAQEAIVLLAEEWGCVEEELEFVSYYSEDVFPPRNPKPTGFALRNSEGKLCFAPRDRSRPECCAFCVHCSELGSYGIGTCLLLESYAEEFDVEAGIDAFDNICGNFSRQEQVRHVAPKESVA